MKKFNPSLSHECLQRKSDAGRYNPARVALVKFHGRTYSLILGAGTGDDLYFWQSGPEVQCLSINDRLGYCGLQCFALGDTRNPYKVDDETRFDADESGEVFLQVDHEIESALGKRGLELSPATIRTRLSEYCCA